MTASKSNKGKVFAEGIWCHSELRYTASYLPVDGVGEMDDVLFAWVDLLRNGTTCLRKDTRSLLICLQVWEGENTQQDINKSKTNPTCNYTQSICQLLLEYNNY